MSDLRPTLAGARGRTLPLAVGTGAWEAPTLALAALIYGGWLALTLAWHALPLALAGPLAARRPGRQRPPRYGIRHHRPPPRSRLTTALGRGATRRTPPHP